MKGRRIAAAFACLFAAGLMTVANPVPKDASAAEKKIKLRFSMYFTPTSLPGQLYQEFCDEIEKRTDGRVEMTYYPGGTLFGGSQTADGVKNGIADIGYMTTGHYSGRFPVSEAVSSMNGYPSAYVVSHVANDYYQQYKPEEWNDFKVLLAGGMSPMVVFSTKPVRTMEDFAGTKCRTKGKQALQAKKLGASIVGIPIGDAYDALQKGVIDNSATSLEAAKTWRFADICPYLTLTWQVFSPPAYYLIMNKNVWNSLPEDIQKIVDEVSAEYVEKSARMNNEVDVEGAAYSKEKGVEFIQLSDEEAAKWQQAVAPVTEDYVQDMIKKGFSEEEVRGWMTYIKERIAYWSKQQVESGIESPFGVPKVK